MSPTYSAREYIFWDWRLNFIIYTSFYSPLLILINSMPHAKLVTSYIKAWLSAPDRIWPLKTLVREMCLSIVTANDSWPFKNVNYKLPEIYTHKRRMFEQKRTLKVFKTSFPSIESSVFVFPPYWIYHAKLDRYLLLILISLYLQTMYIYDIVRIKNMTQWNYMIDYNLQKRTVFKF
jgi:hypothetical protein